MFKAVFIDLDGTLLRPDHSISEATRVTIHKLLERNIRVILVSARPIHGITPISEWLGITSMPVASLNGAYIELDGKVIFTSSIAPSVAETVHAASLPFDVTLIYYTSYEWYTESLNDHIVKEQRITDIPVIVQPFTDMLPSWKSSDAQLHKMMAIGEEHQVAEFEATLLSRYPTGMNIYTSKPTYLEIMRADASKTNAVKFVMEKYSIKQDEVLAIGDNFNDLGMIQFAGTGVAMGNAPDAIKAVADYVTDTNENDGVRKAIEYFIGT